MAESVNYPDVLGWITGGSRASIGAAQVAAAVRPRIVRAGSPFEVILLVQNAADGEIEVTLTLHLPNADAKKQRDRFAAKTPRTVVSVKGAEVGYVALPVTTLPDTAVSDAYKIGVEVEVKASGKPARIRANEGGGAFAPDRLSEAPRAALDGLKALSFTTTKPFARSVFEVPLTILSSGIAKLTEFTPGWVSLCKVSDYHSNRLLLHRYGPLVQVNTLPKLKRSLMFTPLLETTAARFAEAGYPLKPGEATAIAKLMTLVLEYATPRFNAHGNIAARSFDVEALLLRDPFTLSSEPVFPYWFRGLIDTIEQDERTVNYPTQVIPRYLYEDLLRDAINLGFDLVHEATGEDLGGAPEQDSHREQFIALLKAKAGLDFNRVYLPLVMGGLLISGQLPIDRENPADLLQEISLALDDRCAELSEVDYAICTMTKKIIERAGQRHGFKVGK